MSYMESKMQDQIDGSIHLQQAICDDACEIYKQTGTMPRDMKMQRDELLDALMNAVSEEATRGSSKEWIGKALSTIARATGTE